MADYRWQVQVMRRQVGVVPLLAVRLSLLRLWRRAAVVLQLRHQVSVVVRRRWRPAVVAIRRTEGREGR